jgi:hypothetical protein
MTVEPSWRSMVPDPPQCWQRGTPYSSNSSQRMCRRRMPLFGSRQGMTGPTPRRVLNSNTAFVGKPLSAQTATGHLPTPAATVESDGALTLPDGQRAESLSRAPQLACGLRKNGWMFWRVERDGALVTLEKLRDRLLAHAASSSA